MQSPILLLDYRGTYARDDCVKAHLDPCDVVPLDEFSAFQLILYHTGGTKMSPGLSRAMRRSMTMSSPSAAMMGLMPD